LTLRFAAANPAYGARLSVSLILDLLVGGMTEPELLAEYPGLVHDDVLGAIGGDES
jgi:uncharacterized protein (DUF433 family)